MPPPVLFIDMWPDVLPPGVIRDRFHDVPGCAKDDGLELVVAHHSAVYPAEWISRPPVAIMLSGSKLNLVDDPSEDPVDGTPLSRFQAVTNLLAALPKVPTLGICFGHQYLAKQAGGRLAKMAKTRVDNDFTIEQGEPHALMAGLPERPSFVESHGWRVVEPGFGYRVVATSMDGIEMVQHADLPRVGVQFHPEYYRRQDPTRQHGRAFLSNWFRSLGDRRA